MLPVGSIYQQHDQDNTWPHESLGETGIDSAYFKNLASFTYCSAL